MRVELAGLGDDGGQVVVELHVGHGAAVGEDRDISGEVQGGGARGLAIDERHIHTRLGDERATQPVVGPGGQRGLQCCAEIDGPAVGITAGSEIDRDSKARAGGREAQRGTASRLSVYLGDHHRHFGLGAKAGDS